MKIINSLLRRFLIDVYAYDCEERQRRSRQAEYGISVDDWQSEYPKDVETFLIRIWSQADDLQKNVWIAHAIERGRLDIERIEGDIEELALRRA